MMAIVMNEKAPAMIARLVDVLDNWRKGSTIMERKPMI